MPTSALQILSLGRARLEMGVPEPVSGEIDPDGDLLELQIADAVEKLASDTGRPLLDTIAIQDIALPSGSSVLSLVDPFLRRVLEVRYRPPADGTPVPEYYPSLVDSGDYRVEEPDTHDWLVGRAVLTPVDSWPDTDTPVLSVRYVRGVPDDDPSMAAYTTLAIHLVRLAFEQRVLVPQRTAYQQQITNLQSRTPLADSFRVVGLAPPPS